MNSILRTTAVQSAALRQLEDSARVNISGIAAITGIPRREVSRILNAGGNLVVESKERHQNIANRILSAWHQDPRFLTAGRRPRHLKLFGNGRTFESLTRIYGQGIPVRAMVDELRRVGAIELLVSSQKIFVKKPLAINPRITRKTIKDLAAGVDGLFSYSPSSSRAAFVEKVSGTKAWSGFVPLVRKKSGPNAFALLRELQNKLAIRQWKHRSEDSQKVARLAVTIVYREEPLQLGKPSLKSRRNFHRDR